MGFSREIWVMLVLLAATVLAACGGGSSSSTTKSTATEANPPVAETKPPAEETKPPAEETKPPAEETPTCPTIHPHENYMAIGDSLTSGTGDNISSDDETSDGCFKSRGFPPVLIDKLNSIKGKKHVVWNKGVGGASSQDGSRTVGRLLRERDSMHYLVLYGTNDSANASLNQGVSRQQFKKNMQDIINQIHSAGKSAYLAKIPPALGNSSNGRQYDVLDQGPRNKLIQQYNQVIDELVSENHINIQPPDFYNYFKNHPEEYSDNLHMNGIGYDSMADLWFQRLRHL